MANLGSKWCSKIDEYRPSRHVQEEKTRELATRNVRGWKKGETGNNALQVSYR